MNEVLNLIFMSHFFSRLWFWFGLMILLQILLLAERAEAKKDWNEKPGEPFGENALIIFTDITNCLETKKQNSRLHQIDKALLFQ